MGGDRNGKALEVIAAFQQRHDPAAAALVGDVHQPLRHPGIIGLDQVEIGERVAGMGVEAGGNDDQVRAELGELRQDRDVEGSGALMMLPAPVSIASPVPG